MLLAATPPALKPLRGPRPPPTSLCWLLPDFFLCDLAETRCGCPKELDSIGGRKELPVLVDEACGGCRLRPRRFEDVEGSCGGCEPIAWDPECSAEARASRAGRA